LFIEIEKENKTKDGASSSNNESFQFANNRPEVETDKLDETFAA
jgi:hypothetical protein